MKLILIYHQSQIKRLQQLEQEKELLYQGAEMVDKASRWYRAQIQLVETRLAAGLTTVEPAGEQLHHPLERQQQHQQQQQALHALASRVLNINYQLRALVDGEPRDWTQLR